MMLQSDFYLREFEIQEFSSKNLIPFMLQSFERKNIRDILAATKNFLRFSKGRGFKEISIPIVVENTYSPYFLNQLRLQLLN